MGAPSKAATPKRRCILIREQSWNERKPVDTICAAGAGQSTIPNVQDGLCKLPLFRPVATKILQLTAREDVEIAQLTKLIQADPALSADILLVSNSSLYGFASNIRSVSHAVTVLGLERTK